MYHTGDRAKIVRPQPTAAATHRQRNFWRLERGMVPNLETLTFGSIESATADFVCVVAVLTARDFSNAF